MCSGDGTQWGNCVCKNVNSDAAVDLSVAASVRYVLVDDMEGTAAPNGPIKIPVTDVNLEAGYWMTWLSTGSPLNSAAPDPFAYTAVPAPHQTLDGTTSLHAAHLSCHLADLYGGCAANFWPVEHSATAVDGVSDLDLAKPISYDLGASQGLVFWGMSSRANRVKVLINNIDTVPYEGRCGGNDAASEQCWDAFSKYVTLTETWQRYEIKFSDLFQEGWGHAAPSGKFDATTVYAVGFQVNGPDSTTAPAVDADFWIDDLYLVQAIAR